MSSTRELEINLGGKKYILTPSYYAILDIEGRTGKSINIIMNNFISGAFTFTDQVAVLVAGIRATYKKDKLNLAKAPEYDFIAEIVGGEGYLGYVQPVVNFLKMIIEGSERATVSENTEDETDSEKKT